MASNIQNSKLNSAIFHWSGKLGLPAFDQISAEDFEAAFEIALTEDRQTIDAIADNPEPATFENTIDALESHNGHPENDKLSRTSAIFWNLIGSHSNQTLRDLERKIAPKLSRHASQTAANKKLFARIDQLWSKRESLDLTGEQSQVLERKWKGFVRGGAALDDEGKEQISKINARLADLGSQFSQNILADESSWSLILEEEEDLKGLPQFLRAAMASAADERGHAGQYAVTLSRSIIEPFLTFSDQRELRQQAFEAWTRRGENGGETDNLEIVREIVALRQEKAKLLGFDSFAEFKLEPQMAKHPQAVADLLNSVWEKAVAKAQQEEGELRTNMASSGMNHEIAPWDWRYYSERVRAQKYAFDEAEIKPYLKLDNMIEAAFDVASRLFGVTIREVSGVHTYHPDVRVFEVLDTDGKHKAVFLADYFARPSKRSGAWMSGFQGQHDLLDGQTPIIVNVMNFAKAPEGEVTLLSMDDARTLFHEFGHALHGMLSDVRYPSVSGTSVARDFVELPSQVFEHWLMVPEILSKHARHAQTGEAIPDDLLKKIIAAQTFNAGFGAVEFTASALVDLEFHKAHESPVTDVLAFELEVLERIGMPSSITMRHRTPHFAHVFSGDGYSAGYYSYMWSEVLDADAFRAFEEVDDPFDPELAGKLHDHIYSTGGSVDAQDAYVNFRGKMPNADAMMEKRGLV